LPKPQTENLETDYEAMNQLNL